MFSQCLIRLKRVFWLPIIFVLLHAAFLLWVGLISYQAVEEYDTIAGPEANFAWNLVHFVDFPIYWLCHWGICAVLESQSHTLASILGWMLGDDPLRNLEIRLYLPLLLLFGSIQWVLVGYGIRWIKKFMYARLGKRTG
jgi:hypothetical protein